ncbi:hypothetical protein CPSG_08581 [Coccidioides posadasii str. Silveira]|uniref:Uncharacterized protein n=1 Tax=Coccidioides posadasii (strain RMSCC 757 / Silveira) TaxID=443226 RepID=E9DF25_COCPS|nr:hypothetical protein CPSG_08581 [Coccidioides posadasii str. Silveira]
MGVEKTTRWRNLNNCLPVDSLLICPFVDVIREGSGSSILDAGLAQPSLPAGWRRRPTSGSVGASSTLWSICSDGPAWAARSDKFQALPFSAARCLGQQPMTSHEACSVSSPPRSPLLFPILCNNQAWSVARLSTGSSGSPEPPVNALDA